MSSSSSANVTNPQQIPHQSPNPNIASFNQQHATPSKPKKKNAKSPKSTPKSTTGGPSQFTPLMQDAQARGKDPARGRDGEGSSDSEMEWWGDERFNAYGFDNYERTQQRRGAALILDNPELIMMHALARGDSIPGTRNYFTKMMCGYLDPNDIYKEKNFEDGDTRPDKTSKAGPSKSRRKSGIDG